MSTNDNPDKTKEEEFEEEDFDEEDLDSTETEGEDDDDPSSGSDDEDPEEGSDDDDEGEDKKNDPLAKFKGKSTEEVIEMYRNLETRIDSEALKKAQKILSSGGVSAKDKKKADKAEEDDFDLTDEQIKAMTPKQFAQWADNRITLKATKIAQDIISRSTEVRENVRREIAQATKNHPHLKTNKQYREIVLDRIEASKARGKLLTLTEACKQVDKAMGIKPGEGKGEEKKKEEEKPKPKPRTGVEKQDGTDGEQPKNDEDKVKDGMLNAGGKKSVLGGLGI